MTATLITGADGYLGRRIAAALAASREEVVLAVRAGSEQELAAKRAAFAPGAEVVAADLPSAAALDGVDPDRIQQIVHAAAITRFTVDQETARLVNVTGTERVLAFAARCRRLRRVAVLSTLYSAGRATGEIAERPPADEGFVNDYEWSKQAAETVALASGLPVSVLRLATVVADDAGGRVTQYNAFHNTLKLYYYGLLSLVPGDPATPLSLATADFTVAAVLRFLDPEVPAGIYHLCPPPARTASLGDVIEAVFRVFERDEGFRRRGLLRPLYCDRDSFHDLVAAAEGLRGGPLNAALASVAPFAEQLYLPKTFRADALAAIAPELTAPDPVALVESVCTSLIGTRWGRTSGSEHALVRQ